MKQGCKGCTLGNGKDHSLNMVPIERGCKGCTLGVENNHSLSTVSTEPSPAPPLHWTQTPLVASKQLLHTRRPHNWHVYIVAEW